MPPLSSSSNSASREPVPQTSPGGPRFGNANSILTSQTSGPSYQPQLQDCKRAWDRRWILSGVRLVTFGRSYFMRELQSSISSSQRNSATYFGSSQQNLSMTPWPPGSSIFLGPAPAASRRRDFSNGR